MAERTPWKRVAALVFAGMAGAMQIGKVPAALTIIAQELGLSLAAAALLISLFSLLTGIGGLAIGLSAARFGPGRALRAGLVLATLAAIASALAPGFPALLAARILEGAGFLLVVVGAPTLIAASAAPRDRALAMAFWSTYMPAGIALGLALAPLMDPLGWRGMWLVSAGAMGLAGLAAFRAMPAADLAPPGGAPAIRAQLRALWQARRPVRAAALFGTYNVVYMALAGFLPAFLHDRFGISSGFAGAFAAVVALGNAGGNLVAGLLMRRGAEPGLLIALAASSMGLTTTLLFLAAPGLTGSLALAMLASCLAGVVPASIFALVPRVVPVPALVAPGVGLAIQCSNLAAVLAPPLVGALAQIAWSWVAAPLLLCALLAAWGGLTLRRTA